MKILEYSYLSKAAVVSGLTMVMNDAWVPLVTSLYYKIFILFANLNGLFYFFHRSNPGQPVLNGYNIFK
jgi:hypothetical protein